MALIKDLLGGEPTLSFEFFPPKTPEAVAQLRTTIDELEASSPAFVSVTCGAGGGSQDGTRDIVVDIAGARPFPPLAHVTCVGFSRLDVEELLDDYAASGVTNILALAGDPPADGSEPRGDFRYAQELVELIKERSEFSVGVAAHPEVHPRSSDRDSDRRHLAAKLRAADFAMTQFFFDPADYFRMIDELAALGVDKPVVPGVFPVTAPKTVRRFADMNAARIPVDLFDALEVADADTRLKMAVDHALELSQRLLDGGAPGVHVYTMNRSEAALAIASQLDIS